MKEALKEFNSKVDELELPGMAAAKVKDYAKTLVKAADKQEDDKGQREEKQDTNKKEKSIVELARSKRKI